MTHAELVNLHTDLVGTNTELMTFNAGRMRTNTELMTFNAGLIMAGAEPIMAPRSESPCSRPAPSGRWGGA